MRDEAPPLPGREPTARELAAQLPGQVSALVQQEIALGKAELFATARRSGGGAARLAVAGALGGGAALAMLTAAIAGIAVALPVWAAALIVGGALGAAGGLAALRGARRLPKGGPPLPLTTESLRRDLEELKASAAAVKNSAKGPSGDGQP